MPDLDDHRICLSTHSLLSPALTAQNQTLETAKGQWTGEKTPISAQCENGPTKSTDASSRAAWSVAGLLRSGPGGKFYQVGPANSLRTLVLI
jgi:hypothetical protein